MNSSLAECEIESEVARRFDASEGRFRDFVPADDYRLAALKAELGDVRGRLILDLGCGKGRFANRLREQGATVHGLDLSVGMLAAADAIPRVRASASRLPYADASFDAVLAVEVFQHVAAINSAVREAFRVMVPGGLLLVVDKHAHALNIHRPWLPNLLVKAIDDRRGRGMYGRGSQAKERWRASRTILGLMRAAGFEDCRSRGLLSPQESTRSIFRRCEWSRAMRLWSGRRPGGMP